MPLKNSSDNSPKSAFDQIDAGKIKSGSRFREGSFSSKRRFGLKGQLGGLRYRGRRWSTKNLSKENVETMHDLIAPHLKGKTRGGTARLSRRDVREIMLKAEKMRRSGDQRFTMEDKKDLKKVVKALSGRSKKDILPTSRDVGGSDDAIVQRNIRTTNQTPPLTYQSLVGRLQKAPADDEKIPQRKPTIIRDTKEETKPTDEKKLDDEQSEIKEVEDLPIS